MKAEVLTDLASDAMIKHGFQNEHFIYFVPFFPFSPKKVWKVFQRLSLFIFIFSVYVYGSNSKHEGFKSVKPDCWPRRIWRWLILVFIAFFLTFFLKFGWGSYVILSCNQPGPHPPRFWECQLGFFLTKRVFGKNIPKHCL
jgi:hypothetical protein